MKYKLVYFYNKKVLSLSIIKKSIILYTKNKIWGLQIFEVINSKISNISNIKTHFSSYSIFVKVLIIYMSFNILQSLFSCYNYFIFWISIKENEIVKKKIEKVVEKIVEGRVYKWIKRISFSNN